MQRVEASRSRWPVVLGVLALITAIDGHDVTGANRYLFSSLIRVPEGTVVTLGLARGASVQITAGKRP